MSTKIKKTHKIIKSPYCDDCLTLLFDIKENYKQNAYFILDNPKKFMSVNFVNMLKTYLYRIEEIEITDEELYATP